MRLISYKDPTGPRAAIKNNDPRQPGNQTEPGAQQFVQGGYRALLDMLGMTDDQVTSKLGDATDFLTQNKYTRPVMQGAFDMLAPYFYENIRPDEYPTTSNILNELVRIYEGKQREPVHDPMNRPVAAEEAYRMALGLPVDPYYFEDSPYRPSISQDSQAQYKRLRRDMFDMNKINELAHTMDGTRQRMSGFNQLLKDEVEENLGLDPFQNYTVSLGEDEHGKYLSYIDNYDFEGPLNSFIRPFETYDRFYYDTNYVPNDPRPRVNYNATYKAK